MTDELIEALERLADANAEGLALSKSRVLTDQGPQHRILYIEVIARDVLPTRSGPSAAMVREAFELGEIFVAEAMRRNPPPERIVVSDEAMERVTESLDRPPAPTQALRELITEPPRSYVSTRVTLNGAKLNLLDPPTWSYERFVAFADKGPQPTITFRLPKGDPRGEGGILIKGETLTVTEDMVINIHTTSGA